MSYWTEEERNDELYGCAYDAGRRLEALLQRVNELGEQGRTFILSNKDLDDIRYAVEVLDML